MSNDLHWIDDILRHGREAIEFLEGVPRDAFLADRKLQLTIERLLEIVGEAAGQVGDATRDEIPADWRRMRGLRNILAHAYGSVDHAVLWAIVRGPLPAMLDALEAHRQPSK